MREAFDLFKQISIINQLASAELDRVLPEGLHPAHFVLVNHLAATGVGKTPIGLARAFQISKQNMTSLVVQLQKRGLITIESHPTDGRSKLVHLTPEGHQFHATAVEAASPMLREVANHESFEAVRQALPALNRLRAYLDSRRMTGQPSGLIRLRTSGRDQDPKNGVDS